MNEKFLDVLKHEGVVTIVTQSEDRPHLTNTWNSYLRVKDDKILIPAAGMKTAEENIKRNGIILIAVGSKEVEGFNGYQGTGFNIDGQAEFITEGDDYNKMKEEFPFLDRVLEVKIKDIQQKI